MLPSILIAGSAARGGGTLARTADACPGSVLARSQTISLTRSIVVYGRVVFLTGKIGRPILDQEVALLLKRYDESSDHAIVVVRTDADGRWRYVARPTIRSSYSACWLKQRLRGQTVTVRVRPRVTLTKHGATFFAKVIAARSFDGRTVFLQRKSERKWKSIKRAVLRRRPLRFRAELPSGISKLRIFFPQRQAGPGYLAGVSRSLVVRR